MDDAAKTRSLCASCTLDQECCSRMSGLRVTPAEFERCFAVHADQLSAQQEGPVHVLSPKQGGACPNWRDGRCAVYADRPRECRLFPFTLFVRRADEPVSLGYHCGTRCPFKAELLASDDEARVLVAEFGREAFGESVSLQVARETLWERLKRRLVSCLRHRWSASLTAWPASQRP